MIDLSTMEMGQQLSNLLARKRNYCQETKDLISQYEYVVFYGCGEVFYAMISTWEKCINRNIDFCCDADNSKWGKTICGIKCISPDELENIKDKCIVFVTLGNFQPVFKYLLEKGFSTLKLIFKYDLEISDFLATHELEWIKKQLNETYALLSDWQSRKVFNAIVTRVLGDGSKNDIMLEVNDINQYFPPEIIQLTEHERLVDIGAFDGDTIMDFVGRTIGRFDQITSFEVDAVNFKALQENVSKMQEKNRIKILNIGVWDSECDITYNIGESQSTVGAIGEGKGHVVPLDNVLQNDKVTFIKMDIEGAELNALRGARNIIQSQKPRLAICTYHDFKHLWEIPLYIKSLVPEYKIYLRHHTNLEYETVCYAVAG